MADAVSYFMVDVEADGPISERYSMVAIGAVIVEPGLQQTFYGRLRPAQHLGITRTDLEKKVDVE